MLSILGSVYAKIADIRNSLYDKGTLRSYSLGAKTISVGNITTGGTGKTPLVAYIANILAERGEKVCILTRGYGRKDENERILVSDGTNILTDPRLTGDEPLELAKILGENAVIIADADRVAAGKWAKEKFDMTAFVLDDGFQHRKVKRDLDIVCIDAANPFDNEKILPAGHLREPLANLKRADVVVITRANLAEDIDSLRHKISSLTNAQIFECRTLLNRIISLQRFNNGPNHSDEEQSAVKERAFAFCGIGNPSDFFRSVEESFDLRGSKAFPDHHKYSKIDIGIIEQEAAAAGANILITTGKDAVKLNAADFRLPCFVADISLAFNNEVGFQALL